MIVHFFINRSPHLLSFKVILQYYLTLCYFFYSILHMFFTRLFTALHLLLIVKMITSHFLATLVSNRIDLHERLLWTRFFPNARFCWQFLR